MRLRGLLARRSLTRVALTASRCVRDVKLARRSRSLVLWGLVRLARCAQCSRSGFESKTCSVGWCVEAPSYASVFAPRHGLKGGTRSVGDGVDELFESGVFAGLGALCAAEGGVTEVEFAVNGAGVFL